ncbi:hypothetical protein [Celeribacter sp.]|uniref:hypothetical protein n=1 Tax=Celeribacter sp. TaxID=1890673 RepID=UPI003A926AF8
MTTFPLSYLSDVLKVTTPTATLRRYDEASGSGDGRMWSAELSKPLWAFNVPLRKYLSQETRSVRAKVGALQGQKHDFLFADPAYKGPAADEGGAVLGASAVKVGSISSDRTQVSFSGLPSGYTLSAGDRFSVAFGSGHYYLGEIAEDAVADGNGDTEAVMVAPWVSLGVEVGDDVELVAPVLKVIVESFTPATDQLGGFSSGSSLSLLQRPF